MRAVRPGHDHRVAGGPSQPISVARDDGHARVALAGELDMALVFRVEPVLDRTLAAAGLERLTIDLSGLAFIDSTGVGVLLRMEQECRQRGVALALVPGPREVQQVFEVAGLGGALPFAPG